MRLVKQHRFAVSLIGLSIVASHFAIRRMNLSYASTASRVKVRCFICLFVLKINIKKKKKGR